MKKVFSYVIVLIALTLCSCFGNTNREISVSAENANATNSQNDYLLGMVLSSNFPFPKNVSLDKIQVEIDSQENNVYLCRLYFETEGTGTLGWIKYDANCQMLYNVTDDENFEQLTFTNSWAQKINLDIKNKSIEASVYTTYLNQAKSYDLITLPFSLDEYLNFHYNNSSEEVEKRYPFYTPKFDLEAYLKSIDYEGEEYKCFIAPSNNPELLVFLIWVLRGDSEYYLIITANKTRIEDYLECGVMGVDNPIYFIWNKNLEIKRLKKVESGIKDVEKFQIQPSGNIVKMNK